MGESAEGFYDDLAQWYHLIFEDWNRSIAYQGAVLGPILERHTGKETPPMFWTVPVASGRRPSG